MQLWHARRVLLGLFSWCFVFLLLASRSFCLSVRSSNPSTMSDAATKTDTPVTLPPIMIDNKGRKLGREDPNDPCMQDDPAIIASVVGRDSSLYDLFRNDNKPNVSTPAIEGARKKLINNNGKAFVDPRTYGGSLLDRISPRSKLGEPLNVIISGLSSPELLTHKDLQNYLRSLDFDDECLGEHSGGKQQAFVDPRGYYDQVLEYRQVYTPLDHVFGTCTESIVGGNHLRAWQQMGTGAWFLAVSKEEDLSQRHTIAPNGYNIGRDLLVRKSKDNAGQSSFFAKAYETKVEYLSGLMPSGKKGVNHGIATDGRIALLTVRVTASDLPVKELSVDDDKSAAKSGNMEQSRRQRKRQGVDENTDKAQIRSTAAKTKVKRAPLQPRASGKKTSSVKRAMDKLAKRLSRPFGLLSTR